MLTLSSCQTILYDYEFNLNSFLFIVYFINIKKQEDKMIDSDDLVSVVYDKEGKRKQIFDSVLYHVEKQGQYILFEGTSKKAKEKLGYSYSTYKNYYLLSEGESIKIESLSELKKQPNEKI